MSNSPLVNYIALSPNHSGRRTKPISKIAIHHVAGVLSVETIGRIFAGSDRSASSNYGIGYDGRIGMFVEEANRSWCTSSAWVDQQAVTIEVSNSAVGGDWPVAEHVLAKLVDLCVDICKRNEINHVAFTGDRDGTLVMHKWFAATACPGQYQGGKFGWIAEQINSRLKVAVAAPETNAPVSVPATYTVVPGDSLSRIGAKFGLEWHMLAKINGIANPSLIHPGQIIRLVGMPEEPKPVQIVKNTHVVKVNENLSVIAEKYDTTWRALAQLNGIPNPSLIYPGQVLSIATASGATKTLDNIAREVLRGDWGDGQDRKGRLIAAGYDYNAVQNRVNELI